MKIRMGDLKRPQFYYLYRSINHLGENPPYRLCRFSIFEETGEEILTILFKGGLKTPPINPQAILPLSAWGYHAQAKTIGKLFSQIYPGDPYRPFRRLLKALAYMGIPRYALDNKGRGVPWKYRNHSEDYIRARNLVSP